MKPKLPDPVATYIAAVKDKNIAALANCFNTVAVVQDEGREHRGLAAIQAWKKETDTKYRHTIEPLDAVINRDTVQLRARLTGDFPGSPVELDYQFRLSNNKITSLEIR